MSKLTVSVKTGQLHTGVQPAEQRHGLTSFGQHVAPRLPQPHGPERCPYCDAPTACSVRALQRGASPLVAENEISSAIQAVAGKPMPKSTGATGAKLRIGRIRLYGGEFMP